MREKEYECPRERENRSARRLVSRLSWKKKSQKERWSREDAKEKVVFFKSITETTSGSGNRRPRLHYFLHRTFRKDGKVGTGDAGWRSEERCPSPKTVQRGGNKRCHSGALKTKTRRARGGVAKGRKMGGWKSCGWCCLYVGG